MEEEYLKRWRLILGGNEADGTGITLTQEEQRIDQSLEAVYDSDRRGGLGSETSASFSRRRWYKLSNAMPSND